MKIISKIVSVTKLAMAVPAPTGETAQKMKDQGLYMIQDMLKRMPNTTQKEMHEALNGIIESGASEFFSGMKPKTVISLPSIYILNPDDIFEVDSKRYVSITVDPPRVVGQKWVSPSGVQYIKGQRFEGEVTALDLDTGMPAILPLASIRDKIIAPTADRAQVLEKANGEIAKYNERIRSINKAVGASKLVLQIARAKDQIQTRLNTLESMKQAIQRNIDRFQQSPKEAFDAYAEDLKQSVQSGEMSLKDAYDTILYLHMSTPERLISDIESNTLRIPEELRAGILAIARKEVESTIRTREEKVREEREREERIQQQSIPEIHDVEIEPFVMEDIPGAKEGYKEVDTPKSLWHHISSLKASLAGTIKDAEELGRIKQSIDNMERYMGDLEKGQRSREFLTTPEGRPILDAMNDFLNNSSLFIKRYATDIIQDGKVNPKLMGPKGTQGNALVAVSLTRMYNVVKETIAMYSAAVETPPSREPVEVPAPVQEPVAKSEDKITKMSGLLWKAFEDRMRLR